MNRDQLLLNNRARRLGGKIELNPELPAPRTKARTSASALLSVFLMVSMSLEDDDGGYDDGSDYRGGGDGERWRENNVCISGTRPLLSPLLCRR